MKNIKKVVVSAGPIPAMLDSVKFVTNRFKGGLALKTAQALKNLGWEVTLVSWVWADFKETDWDGEWIKVKDVKDYYHTMLDLKADAYVLAAAVANLMPSCPWEGKFPSHQYQEGDHFQVEFEIAPRLIDALKKQDPSVTLIGYKLLDGSTEELVKAARKTLKESKANLVWANHPQWAKEKKIAITSDGNQVECTWDEHIQWTDRLLRSQFYRTEIKEYPSKPLNSEEEEVFKSYPQYPQEGQWLGCVAVRREHSWITTLRGKKEERSEWGEVWGVDHDSKIIQASKKCTLNAPLLDRLWSMNKNFKIILHGHEKIGKILHECYEFPGTDRELVQAAPLKAMEPLGLKHHGYVIGLETIEQYRQWIQELKNKEQPHE